MRFLALMLVMLSACAAFASPSDDAEFGAAKIRFGVLSDAHLGIPAWRKPIADRFEKALKCFREADVDAVMVAGDIADGGFTDELQLAADAWKRVFPDDFGKNGKKVEKLFITGNHDMNDFLAFKDGKRVGPAYVETKNGKRRDYIDVDPTGVWACVFGEKVDPVFAKTVKGYVFIGAFHGYEKEVPGFLADNADRLGLKTGKPFFYLQHDRPHPSLLMTGGGVGIAVSALRDYPSLIAFGGHWHGTLTDEKSVEQDGYLAFGTATLDYLFAPYGRENGAAYGPGVSQMPIAKTDDSAQGLLVTLYERGIVAERLDFVADKKLGADWRVPLDGKNAYSIAARAAKAVPPEFAPGDEVTLVRAVGKNRRGVTNEQVMVSFPAALPSVTSRVFEYEVRALTSRWDVDRAVVTKRVLSETFHLPPDCDGKPGACVFAVSELPKNESIRFAVRPVECFGKKGHEIVSEALILK